MICPAQLAQLVEHFHGKEGVSGSSPELGLALNAGHLQGIRRDSEQVPSAVTLARGYVAGTTGPGRRLLQRAVNGLGASL